MCRESTRLIAGPAGRWGGTSHSAPLSVRAAGRGRGERSCRAGSTPPDGGAAEKGLSESRPYRRGARSARSEEHTSELQSLMRISYAVFCLKNKKMKNNKSCSIVEV